MNGPESRISKNRNWRAATADVPICRRRSALAPANFYLNWTQQRNAMGLAELNGGCRLRHRRTAGRPQGCRPPGSPSLFWVAGLYRVHVAGHLMAFRENYAHAVVAVRS